MKLSILLFFSSPVKIIIIDKKELTRSKFLKTIN